MKYLKKESGVTLIEVVASIVIITIVLLSFSQLFIQTKKTAVYNNEKLVLINLADATLAKLQNQSFPKTADTDLKKYFNSPSVEKSISMNGKTYEIEYKPEQSNIKYHNLNEIELGLIKVEIIVYSPNKKTKGVTEGYVKIQ